MEFQKKPDGGSNPLEKRQPPAPGRHFDDTLDFPDQVETPAPDKPKKTRTKYPKPLGPVAKFFKWLFLIPLFSLTAGAIVLQFPWKITAILFIFFAANTMLPRRGIKWFWLCVVGVMAALAVWVMLPEEDQGTWAPYVFEEEIAAFNARYAVPEHLNAAGVYEYLFENFDSNELRIEVDSGIRPAVMEQPWQRQHYPEVAAEIDSRADVFEVLAQLGGYEKCFFEFEGDFSERIKQYSRFRDIARAAVLAANNNLGQGDAESAVTKLLTVWQMGSHLQQQPVVIEFLVGIVIEALANNGFTRAIILGQLDDQLLDQIAEGFDSLEFDFPRTRLLDGEQLYIKQMMASFIYERNEEGQVRFLRSQGPLLSHLTKAEAAEYSADFWVQRLYKLNALTLSLWMPHNPRDLSLMIDRAYGPFYAGTEMDIDSETILKQGLNFRTFVDVMTGITAPVSARVETLYTRVITERRGTRLVVALGRYKNQHGQWPDSLDEVQDMTPELAFADAYNHEPFVYQRIGDSFKLYSKGPSGDDHGGVLDRGPEADADAADDWIIWPKD